MDPRGAEKLSREVTEVIILCLYLILPNLRLIVDLTAFTFNNNLCVVQRFEKTYEALEQENIAEARQLHGIHEERVQATLGKKRQDAVNHFRSLLKNNAQV